MSFWGWLASTLNSQGAPNEFGITPSQYEYFYFNSGGTQGNNLAPSAMWNSGHTNKGLFHYVSDPLTTTSTANTTIGTVTFNGPYQANALDFTGITMAELKLSSWNSGAYNSYITSVRLQFGYVDSAGTFTAILDDTDSTGWSNTANDSTHEWNVGSAFFGDLGKKRITIPSGVTWQARVTYSGYVSAGTGYFGSKMYDGGYSQLRLGVIA